MKSLYIKAEHVFQEQPELKEPNKKDFQKCVARPFHEVDIVTDAKYYDEVKKYDAHIASLRKIPCRPGDIWQEGVVYEEHLDYEVEEGTVRETGAPYLFILPIDTEDEDIYDAVRRKRNQAQPEPPTGDEDLPLKKYLVIQYSGEYDFEIWRKSRYDNYIKQTLAVGACPAVAIITHFDGDERLLSGTPKQEGKEAVEFGEFLKSYSSIEHAEKILWWDRIQGSSRYYSTEQLFKLFKEDTNKPQPELFTKEQVAQLIREAFIEGFRNNGVPLGEWSDNLEGNEEQLKEFINSKLQPGVKG